MTQTNLVELAIARPDNSAEAVARAAFEAAEARTVASDEDYHDVAGELQAVKAKWQTIETQRKKLLSPVDESRKTIMEFFRGPLNFLERAEAAYKKKLSDYSATKQRKRQEEQAKADELARKEREKLEQRAAKAEAGGKAEKAELLQRQAAATVAPVVQHQAPKVAGISERLVWRFEITDPTKIPREYLSVDEKKIGGVVRSLKGDANIPGVRVYSESVVAAGASR
jgi:hypothetical protein